MARVSFDFDGTLTQPKVEEYCAELIKRGCDVIIVTYRMLKNASEVIELADRLNISHHNIYFTQTTSKVGYLKGCAFHLDDDGYTISEINKSGVTTAINCFGNNSWKDKCERLLNKKIYQNKIPD